MNSDFLKSVLRGRALRDAMPPPITRAPRRYRVRYRQGVWIVSRDGRRAPIIYARTLESALDKLRRRHERMKINRIEKGME